VSDTISIDGFGPLPVRAPESVAELGEIVRAQVAAGHGVYPVGGGTKLHLGLVPSTPGVAVSTRKLNAVIDYPARDMTVTVQAGIRVADLQTALAAEGQWLPVDVPLPGEATLGGAVAANTSGPRRLGQGTLRDSVIGIGFVSDEGVEVKGGGRVVKNVAGYDLMKLHTGALGTLGVLTHLTLKVKPRPEASMLVAFGVGSAAVGPTLDRLHASQSRPVAVELLNREAAARTGMKLPDTDPWVILCGFEEKAVTVDWQVNELKSELASAPVRDVTEFRDAAVWAALTDLQTGTDSGVSLKANVPPSGVGAFVAAAVAAHPEAVVHAHAGSGIVFVHLPAEDTPDRAANVVAGLSKWTATGNANLIVTACPSAWKGSLPVWGRDAGDRVVMRTVKRTLDPADAFNPGRLWG
jgi:glycolate oxidase FAD binding subunit